MKNFLKPYISWPTILESNPGNPLGYVTNDGMWAAVPIGKKFMIIHNGNQVKIINTYKQAIDFILNQKKTTKKKSRK